MSSDKQQVCAACVCHVRMNCIDAREMMFNLGDRFLYGECPACKTLTLLTRPSDWSRYYPSDYYSFSNRVEVGGIRKNKLCLTIPWLQRFRHDRSIASVFRSGLTRKSRVLDVGCGSGKLLYALKAAGCTKLRGIDPFAIATNNDGVRIDSCTIFDVIDEFDLIMFHHSFEHLYDPEKALTKARSILSRNGRILIRIPVVNWAYRNFGANWVQLDAPRHLYIFSEMGFRRLSERCRLRVEVVEYDSTDFQIYGSEYYAQGIPMKQWPKAPGEQVLQWRRRARDLNRSGAGDQAAFILMPSDDSRCA